MDWFKTKIIFHFTLIFLVVFSSCLYLARADKSEYQKSLTDYQQSQTTFASLQTADEKINGAKDLLSRATQLAIDYQKLIKEEIASINELNTDQKNSFNTRLDSQITANESSLTQITALTDSNQIQDLFTTTKQRWQKDLYLISEINGTALGQRTKEIIQTIKNISQLIEQQIQTDSNGVNQKEVMDFLNEAKQSLSEAQKYCQESLDSFLLATDDQANAETLTSDGQHKFKNCQISLKRSLKSLKASYQVGNFTDTDSTIENIPQEALNSGVKDSSINIDY